MEPRTILFCGREVAVPYLGGRRLVRIAAALKGLAGSATVAGGQTVLEAMRAMPPQEYPRLVIEAAQQALDGVTTDPELTGPERLFYGTLGGLIGCDADTVADAPLEDLTRLVQTVYHQEAETQAGKWLISTLSKSELGTGESTSDGETSGESSATTIRKKANRMAATGSP